MENDVLTPEKVQSFIDEDQAGTKDALRQSVMTASDTNPDTYAEATKLGRQVGVPPEIVAADLPRYKNDTKLSDSLTDTLVNKYPRYAQWLQDPDNARLVHDDLPALSMALDTVRGVAAAGAQIPADIIGQTGKGLKDIAQAGMNASVEQMTPAGQAIDSFVYGGISFVGDVLEFSGDSWKTLAAGIRPKNQNALTMIAEGLGQFAVQAYMVSKGNVGGAFAVGASQGAAQQRDTIAEKEKATGKEVSTMETLARVGAGSLVTGATELVPVEAVLGKVKIFEKILDSLPPALKNKYLNKFVRIGAAGAAEAIQETSENLLHDAISVASGDKNVEFFKEWKQVAGVSGAVGSIAQALVMAVTGRHAAGRAIHGQAAAEAQKEAIRRAQEAVAAAKLQTRDPEKMKEVLQSGVPDGSTMRLDGNVVEQFYQSEDDIEAFFEAAPSAREQFQLAKETGSDIEIPLEEFLHAITSAPANNFDYMVDFAKVDSSIDPALQGFDMSNPDDVAAFINNAILTAREEHAGRFEQVDEQAIENRIERQIRDNLMNTELMGEKARTPEAAAQEAAIYGAFARTMMARGGEAAQRVFEQRFGVNFQIEGYKPPVRSKVGTGSAEYDRLRQKVNARQAKAAKPKPVKQTGLFGNFRRKREAATPKPIMAEIIKQGGVKRDSPIAGELEHMGITPKQFPSLFRKDGRFSDFDTLVTSEWNDSIENANFTTEGETGYIPQQEFFDKLVDEANGNYIRTDEQLKAEQIDENDQAVLDALREEGVLDDFLLGKLSAKEIDAAIQKAAERYRQEYESGTGGLYYQTNMESKFGAYQKLDNGKRIVKLFQKANQSTFLHETGHMFLDLFAEIAAQKDAPQDIKDSHAKMLEWMGVASAAEITVKQHEQFARGFEAYLYKGEAPSLSLRSVFSTFKVWLTNLYKSIKQLNVEVSPEMKDVFDRMLATQEEINAARSSAHFNPDEATLEMLSPAQQEDYLKRKDEALREARDKLFRKAYRQKKRQATEWWKQESDRVSAEVEKELQARPVYKAIKFLQDGTDFEGNPIEGGKLNEASIVRTFDESHSGEKVGKFELKYLPRGVRMTEGGLDVNVVADMFGFPSGIKLLEEMKAVAEMPYKKAVPQMTEDRMVEKYGDMLNDGTIEQEAIAMVMEEDTKSAQVELKALSEKTGAAYPSDGDFKKAAGIALGQLTVDQAIKPEKFQRAALKAAREYGSELRAKDYEKAAAAKRKEVLNKHLHRLSRDAKVEQEKALRRFAELQRQPAKGNAKAVKIDPEYHQKIWDILDKYNLNPRISQAKELKLQLQALNDWIKAKETDEDAVLMMPPELLAAEGKTHYRDLTMNEFRGLRDLVVNLETQGRLKRKFILNGQAQELEALIDQLIGTAENYNALTQAPLNSRAADRSAKRKFSNMVNGLDAINTKTQQMMVQLDGGDNFGLWTKTIYEPVQAAEIEKNRRMRDEYVRFNAMLEKHYGMEKPNFMNRVVVPGYNADTNITQETMLSIALLYTGTENTRTKLVAGYKKTRGWDNSTIENILSNMTKRDWDFVMETRQYLDSFWSEASAIEQRRFGYAPEKQEALPDEEFRTVDGETVSVKGGYMRIKYDAAQDAAAANNEVAETFKDMTIGRNARAATKRGSMIEQVAGVERPIRLDFGVLTEHIAEQVAYITMAETIENVNKVMRNPDLQQTLQQTIGEDKRQMLELWLKDVSVGGQIAAGKLSFLKTIRQNYTVGRLGLRPLTSLLQLSGLAHVAADADIGIKGLARGLMKLNSTGNPLEISDWIHEKSVYMKERKFTLTRDVSDALAAYTDKGQSTKQKFAALMLYPMQKVQGLTDNITWLAAYDTAQRKGMAENEAVRVADLAVSRLQASGLVSDLAAIERGTVGTTVQRQELVKATTMFFSYFNAKYNIIKNANVKFNNKEINGVELATSYLMAILVEGLISAAIMGQLDWDDDKDGELSGMEVGMGLLGVGLSQGAATIPFVRTIAGGAEGFSGETAAMGQLAGLGEFVGRLGGTAEKLIKGDTDKINTYSLVRQGVDALNVFVPLPAGMINQFIRGFEKDQKDGDAELLDYLVYRK